MDEIKKFEDHSVLPNSKEATEVASSTVDETFEKIETPSDHPHVEALSEVEDGAQSLVQDKPGIIPKEDDSPTEEKDLVDHSQGGMVSDDQSSKSTISFEGSQELGKTSAALKTDEGSNGKVQASPAFTESIEADEKSEVKVVPTVHFTIVEREKVLSCSLFKIIEFMSILLNISRNI